VEPRGQLALSLTRRAPRNVDFGELQETFLVSAVTTILVIRTQLWLTNYPQLGGHGLHIAHLLWGGMFMVIAIGILVTFLGRSPRRAGAVVGGVGFGFFIDELGKFITADNNYFFKPAAALIYLIFIGLFLLTRALQRDRDLSPAERVSNAIDLAGEAAVGRLDEPGRRRALALLDGADPGDPLVAPARRLLEAVDAPPARRRPRIARWAEAVRTGYLQLVEQGWFRPLVALVFAFWAAASVIAVFELVLSLGLHAGGAAPGFASDAVGRLTFVNIASLASSLVSAVLVLIGLRDLRAGDRAAAYDAFARALFVSIFVTRVFAFVESQFAAVFGLGIDLLLLLTVRAMANAERFARQRRRGRASTNSPSHTSFAASGLTKATGIDA
jgi:hypothetical protein